MIAEEKNKLILVLTKHLAGKLSHRQVQEHIDSILNKWDQVENKGQTTSPYAKDEKEFWCTVWATQHLATEDDSVDGCTTIESSILLKVLKNEALLPNGYSGLRP